MHVTPELDALRRVCRELATERPDLVILSGGDGTLMAGITALADAFGERDLPAVAPIPGGTAGTVARNWGVRGHPVRRLERLLAGPTVRVLRPTLSVQAEGRAPETVERRIGFIFGTGLVARFFELYYARGAPGYRGAARIVARVFVESFVGGPFARRVLDPLPCRLSIDGRRLAPEAWSLVCASVVPDLGIHLLVNYRAAEDFSRPHLVASALPAHRLGPRAPFVLAGRRIGGSGHVDELVRELGVELGAEGPYVLDGELLRACRVVVRAGPALRVVTAAPRRAAGASC
jgi:hypothetical protein